MSGRAFCLVGPNCPIGVHKFCVTLPSLVKSFQLGSMAFCHVVLLSEKSNEGTRKNIGNTG